MAKSKTVSKKKPTRLKPNRFSNKKITTFVVIFALIGIYMLWQAFAATTLSKIEAETLTGSGASVSDSGTQSLKLTTNTPANGSVTTSSATTDITVRARGDLCKGSPQLNVSVGRRQVLAATVTSSYTNYSATLSPEIAAGTLAVKVTFTNPYSFNKGKNACARALYVDNISLVNTPAPAPPPPGTSPSGQAMPVGDVTSGGHTWKQIFTDDFTTDVPIGQFPQAVSSKWGAYPNGWTDTSKHGVYNCTKVCSVGNGMLDMYIHSENGTHYVANPFPVLPAGTNGVTAFTQYGVNFTSQQYGRYAVRFRADPLHLYKTAWLLWPQSDVWPRDGEIDFPEGDLDSTISAFMHRMNGTSGSDQDGYFTQATYPTWHTAVIEWGPDACSFYLDGVKIGTSTSRIPSTPMRWALQTETALSPDPAPDNTTAGHLQIDWVSVYSYN